MKGNRAEGKRVEGKRVRESVWRGSMKDSVKESTSEGMREGLAKAAVKRAKKRALSNRALLHAAAALMTLLLLFMLFNLIIAGPAEALAKKRLSASASSILNASVKEVMDEYLSRGDRELAFTELNADGSAVLYVDSVKLNRMATGIVERAQQKIAELSARGISFPLGSACHLPILSGTGPRVVVRVEPAGEVSSRLSSKFEDAGVNQTRFTAFVTMKAEVEMLLFGRQSSVCASMSAPICETIIIGRVPNAYTNVETIDEALNLIPTEAESVYD